jgi:cystathionine beta-lyase/cystathionine gamma-synthase
MMKTAFVVGVVIRVRAHCRQFHWRQVTPASLGVESTIERRSKLPGQEHVPVGFLRLSVGCERVDGLWGDLNSALAQATRPRSHPTW